LLFCAVIVKCLMAIRGVYLFRVPADFVKLKKIRIHFIFVQLRIESLNW